MICRFSRTCEKYNPYRCRANNRHGRPDNCEEYKKIIWDIHKGGKLEFYGKD